MKYADCNARQKKAYRNIYHASNWLLGGLENTDDGHLRRRKLLLQPGGGKLPEGHPLLRERMVDGQMRS